MAGLALAGSFDRSKLQRYADWLAMAVVASLPWSTTATGILVALWLIALLPTLNIADVRREVFSWAGGLPVLLTLVALLGMAWADVDMAARFDGFKSFLKLLMIPLLLAQFRRSERGIWVLVSFFASCTLLLVVSFTLLLLPPPLSGTWGVPVKNYIVQSIEFVICAFAAARLALDAGSNRRVQVAWLLLAAAFLANVFFVATGRTALVIVAILLALFALRHFRARGALATLLVGVLLAAVLWAASPYLRGRVGAVWDEVERYRTEHVETSSGFRLEFWKKSAEIISLSPLIGHGTGSIRQQFQRVAVGHSGMASAITDNPHNQTLTVGIQLGALGMAILFAMWIAHLLLFRSSDVVSWIGLVFVAQNVVGSALNSHLFDFTEGWIYIFGVGVAGGMVLRSGRAALPWQKPPP